MSLAPLQVGRNLWTCAMECRHWQRPQNGVALCLRNSRDHILNAQEGRCPDGRFTPIPQSPARCDLSQKRDICAACPASGGFEETISGREADGPEVVNCSSCPCPLQMVNLRTGRCPRRAW